jgi:hypothetical protein
MRDNYSNLGFFNAFPVGPTGSVAAATNGNTIDLRGYDGATMIVTFTSINSGGAGGAGDYIIFVLQHGTASAAGVDQWSVVPGSLLIHSVYGGYDSTSETGIFLSLASASEISGSTQASTVLYVGYKGDTTHRYLRLKISNVGNASALDMGAICILGRPADWPVNSPV